MDPEIVKYLRWTHDNCINKRYTTEMGTKEQIQDTIEVLSRMDLDNLDEDSKEEAIYLINDIVISLEELIDLM
tara:strand:+ start:32 stop:250 length:219 start_codon:yes stop_codon:yes gene_type:complete